MNETKIYQAKTFTETQETQKHRNTLICIRMELQIKESKECLGRCRLFTFNESILIGNFQELYIALYMCMYHQN